MYLTGLPIKFKWRSNKSHFFIPFKPISWYISLPHLTAHPMKTTIKFSLSTLFIYLAVSMATAQPNDIAAIKAVIAKETQSFFSVDRKNWEDCWWSVPYAYWSYSDSTSTSYIEGWEGLRKTFDSYFKTAKPSNAEIVNEWIDVRVYGNGAYVRFVQKVKDEIEHDETSQVRVLEKKDGKWKVICVDAIARYAKTNQDSKVRQ
jgi:hypothetical protein